MFLFHVKSNFDSIGHRTKRIMEYLTQYNPNQADVEPLHSVYAISAFIKKEARALYAWSDANIKVHRPVFKSVISKLAQFITTPAAWVDPEPGLVLSNGIIPVAFLDETLELEDRD